MSAVTYLGLGVFQAKLLQRPGIREALGVPSLPEAARAQEVGLLLGWGGVEFVDETKREETHRKRRRYRAKERTVNVSACDY